MAIKDLTTVKMHLFLCNGGSCKLKGAEDSTAAIRAVLQEYKLGDLVHTTKTLCNGRCKDGPIVISMPGGEWFKEMSVPYARSFVEKFIIKGDLQPDKLLYLLGEGKINEVPVSGELGGT
ncbi:(2Fe-2S) ferredoxin domain-containing protein [Pedobacter jamesrossensis]|uniref:Ferredoxin n=1 Tax=Pedobacter jamesrossensis TaxID=1908238 RepID=A0ABV8NKR1_9SPHI